MIVAERLVKVSLEMDGSLTMFSKDNQCLSTGEKVVSMIEVLGCQKPPSLLVQFMSRA